MGEKQRPQDGKKRKKEDGPREYSEDIKRDDRRPDQVITEIVDNFKPPKPPPERK